MKKNGLIFVISGPSGSGKSTLLGRLLQARGFKNRLVKSVSYTTRPKRTSERRNKDYIFITEKQFHRELRAKKILEWTKYLGYYYATPKDFLEENLKLGKSILLCLDLNGARKVKRLYPESTVTIFIMPPSLDALEGRISGRCKKTKRNEILSRLKLAGKELRAAGRYDYRIVNKDLAQATKDLREAITRGKGPGLSNFRPA